MPGQIAADRGDSDAFSVDADPANGFRVSDDDRQKAKEDIPKTLAAGSAGRALFSGIFDSNTIRRKTLSRLAPVTS